MTPRTGPPLHTLLLLRHGSASNPPGVADHARPLSPNGRRQALAMGRHLADLDLVPTRAIISTAVRAMETFDLAAEAGDWDTTAVRTEALYNTAPAQALAVMARLAQVTPGPVPGERLMLVGHQPTLAPLAQQITSQYVTVGTGSVVVVTLPIEGWSQVVEAPGRLDRIIRARDIRNKSDPNSHQGTSRPEESGVTAATNRGDDLPTGS